MIFCFQHAFSAENALCLSEKCQNSLADAFDQFCTALNDTSRKALARMAMVCSFRESNIAELLPSSDLNDSDFINQLSDNQYQIFTQFFTSIDKTCVSYQGHSSYLIQYMHAVNNAIELSRNSFEAIEEIVKNHQDEIVDFSQSVNSAMNMGFNGIQSLFECLKKLFEEFLPLFNAIKRNLVHTEHIKTLLWTTLLAIIASFVFPGIGRHIALVSCMFGAYEIYNDCDVGISFYYSLCIIILLLHMMAYVFPSILSLFLKRPKYQRMYSQTPAKQY